MALSIGVLTCMASKNRIDEKKERSQYFSSVRPRPRHVVGTGFLLDSLQPLPPFELPNIPSELLKTICIKTHIARRTFFLLGIGPSAGLFLWAGLTYNGPCLRLSSFHLTHYFWGNITISTLNWKRLVTKSYLLNLSSMPRKLNLFYMKPIFDNVIIRIIKHSENMFRINEYQCIDTLLNLRLQISDSVLYIYN